MSLHLIARLGLLNFAMTKLLSLSCLILLTSIGEAQENPLPALPDAHLKFEEHDGVKYIEWTNVDTLGGTVMLTPEKPALILIVQSIEESVNNNTDDDAGGRLQATAYLDANYDTPKKKAWQASLRADRGAIKDDFYVAIADETRNHAPVYTYFNLINGKKLYVSNAPLLSILTDNNHRFIGYQCQFDPDETPKAGDNLIGIVSYGDEHQVTRQLTISGPTNPDLPRPTTPYLQLKINNKTIQSGVYEDVAPTTCEAILHLDDKTPVIIPFDANGPLLDKVKGLPNGYSIKD
jgi:hypothetical protein